MLSKRLLKHLSERVYIKEPLLNDIIHGETILTLLIEGPSLDNVHRFHKLEEVNGLVLGFTIEEDEDVNDEWVMLNICYLGPEFVKLFHYEAFAGHRKCFVHRHQVYNFGF